MVHGTQALAQSQTECSGQGYSLYSDPFSKMEGRVPAAGIYSI